MCGSPMADMYVLSFIYLTFLLQFFCSSKCFCSVFYGDRDEGFVLEAPLQVETERQRLITGITHTSHVYMYNRN